VRVATNLIIGPLGAGKSTAIRQLLVARPEAERWAVLVNEFGEVGIDAATLRASDQVTVREIAGGCVCCGAQMQLRVTLTRLLQRGPRPHRLLIEPTGLGHPAGVVDALRDPWLAEALELRATIALIDPREFSAERIDRGSVLGDQLALADVVVVNKSDLARRAEVEAVLRYVEGLYPPKRAVVVAERANVDPGLLDEAGDLPEDLSAAHSHDHGEEACTIGASGEGPGGSQVFQASDLGVETRGWVFPPDRVFDRRCLLRLFEAMDDGPALGLPALRRAKGVFNTGQDWHRLDWAHGAGAPEPVSYRRDSRLEVLVDATSTPDWERFQAALAECLRQ